MALNDVSIRLSKTVDYLAEGDREKADTNLELARDSALTARRHTRGPIWWTASKLPFIGDDVTAVRVVADVVGDLSDQTLPDLVEAGNTFGPGTLSPVGGRIDLTPIAPMAPVLREGAAELDAGRDRVAAIETGGLFRELRDPVRELQDKLTKAANVAEDAAVAAELMPGMLGQDGPRTYLVMFQNNAEIRALGGMPGAVALVTARDGKIEMTEQGRPATIGTFGESFIQLTEEERALFSTRLSVYPQDSVFVPHFPRAAEILAQMWEENHPQQIDGVLSLDPVAMSYLLRGTGPLELANGKVIDAENGSDYLMRDVYLEVPSNQEQNDLFDDTARRMFDALSAGVSSPRGLLSGLSQAAGERRLMLWSRDDDEQSKLTGTPIAGELGDEPATRPEIGVYVNDASADKLSYYLDYRVDAVPRSCGSEGNQVIDVRVTMRSSVPREVELPVAVTGPATNPVPAGVMLNSIYVYAPVDGRIDVATIGEEEAAMGRFTYDGREVGVLTLDLEPGEERVVDLVIRTGRDQTGRPELVTTPAALGSGQGTVAGSAC